MKSLVILAILVTFTACSGGQQAGEQETRDNQKDSATVEVDAATKASITILLNAYYQLKDALVEYDTASVNSASMALHRAADSLRTEGISHMELASTAQNFAEKISSESVVLVSRVDLVEKKRSFSVISESHYPLLLAVQYNQSTVYHQMCPMAFNDNEAAFWLSNEREIENPYLGKKHPKYASGMLHCGEVKDSLVFGK
jgi:hypothetical protein